MKYYLQGRFPWPNIDKEADLIIQLTHSYHSAEGIQADSVSDFLSETGYPDTAGVPPAMVPNPGQ